VCTYVVAKEPSEKKTTDRAVPIAIFQAEPAVSMTYLKRWCKNIQTIGKPSFTSTPHASFVLISLTSTRNAMSPGPTAAMLVPIYS
jgi:hypothetical protein